MGAVTFSLDAKLLACLLETLPLQVFVETGTFQGNTVEQVIPYFETIHTVELSEVYFERARERFHNHPKVHVHHGSSGDWLGRLAPTLRDSGVLYWLDAHWCDASNTAGTDYQCPLLEELVAIGKLNANSVILIDDARYFLAPPPGMHNVAHWPRFQQILDKLLHYGSSHEIAVVNDVLIAHPTRIFNAVQDYAGKHGFDWGALRGSHDSLLKQVTICNERIERQDALIRSKNELIHRQTDMLNATTLKRVKDWMSGPLQRLVGRSP